MEKFEVKVFETIPEELVEQVDQLLQANGSNNRVRDHESRKKESIEHYINLEDRIKYILTLDKKLVVGIVIVLKREIEFKGERLVVGGIAGVGTKKDYRGKGIATEMLKLVPDILKKAGCDIAYLDTDIKDPMLVKIYQRVGFTILGRASTYLGKSGKRHTAYDGMIAPVNSPEKFQQVLEDPEPFDIEVGAW